MADSNSISLDQLVALVEPYGLWPILAIVAIWRFFPQIAPIIAAWRTTSNIRRKNDQTHQRNMKKLVNHANKPNVDKDE